MRPDLEVTPLSISIPVSTRFIRSLFVVALTLLSLATSHVASAAGRTEWKSKVLKERREEQPNGDEFEDKNGYWKVEVAIYLPRAPDVPHVPMKFEFQPEVEYERTILDSSGKVVDRKVPLVNQQASIESTDVEFLDSGTGKIEARTRFSFKVTRGQGYKAGEYKVTLLDGRNDQKVGTPVTLIFEGKNTVIHREPMEFKGEKKAKKDAKAEDKPKDEGAKEDKPASNSEPAADSDKPQADTADQPQTIKEKPGGCAFRGLADDGGERGIGLAFTALAISSVVLRRRKRAA
ncbi:MAG TPA: hypothetical protein VER12_20790 [Polyangiaceae bacterium]|nr:hypothetical protein [Polyangiaceae bacterium]